jgi:hypothetical protein
MAAIHDRNYSSVTSAIAGQRQKQVPDAVHNPGRLRHSVVPPALAGFATE